MSNLIQFNEKIIQNAIGNDGSIEDLTYSQTSEGYRKMEVIAYYPNNSRKFFSITDRINIINKKEITIYQFNSLKERNNEIKRLYKKERLTQVFISKIFGLSQSQISRIINK